MAKSRRRLYLSRDISEYSDNWYEIYTGFKPPKFNTHDREYEPTRLCRVLKSFCPDDFEEATGIKLRPGEVTEIRLSVKKIGETKYAGRTIKK